MKLIDLRKYDITHLTLEASMQMPQSMLSQILLEEKHISAKIEQGEVAGVFASYSRSKKKQYVSALLVPSISRGKKGEILVSFSRSMPKGLPIAPMRTLIESLDAIFRHEKAEIGKFDVSIHCEFEEKSRKTWAIHVLDQFTEPFNEAIAKTGEDLPLLTGLRFGGSGKVDILSDLIVERVRGNRIHVYLEASEVFEANRKDGATGFFEKAVERIMPLITFIHSAKGLPKNG